MLLGGGADAVEAEAGVITADFAKFTGQPLLVGRGTAGQRAQREDLAGERDQRLDPVVAIVEVLGEVAGALVFGHPEPFKKLTVNYEGPAMDTTFLQLMRDAASKSDGREIFTGDVVEAGQRIRPKNLSFLGHFDRSATNRFETVNFNVCAFPRSTLRVARFDRQLQ